MKRKTCIFKNIVMLFMAIGLVTAFVSCTNKDNDEIGPLRQEVQSLRATLTKEFDAKVNAKAEEFKAQLDKAKADIAALGQRSQGLSLEEVQAEINKATADLINTAAAQAMYDKYVESVRAQLEGAATEAQLNALKQDIEGKIADNSKALGDLSSEVNGKIVTINQKIASLETMVGDSKGAFQKGLDNLKSEITSELDKLKAENPKLRNEISEVERKASEALTMKVNELNEKIEAQKTELVKMLGEYKKANKELIEANGKLIKTNTEDIQGLKDRVQTLESSLATANTNFSNFVDSTLPNLFSTILNSRLTSLVVIPDFVSDNGGALPVINYTPIQTECGIFTPTKGIQLKYKLNPSTVTEADIDKDGLMFVYNSPRLIAARNKKEGNLEVKAKFDKIENGILYVWATPDDLEKAFYGKDDNTENRIDQIMLQVPSKKGDYEVSSDWVRVIYNKDAKEAFLVKHVGDDPLTKPYELAKTISEARQEVYTKDKSTTDKRIVELSWNESLDLQKVVEAVLGEGKMNRKMYGFDEQFTFEINGPVFEGDNQTDQQKFIKLEGSTVSTRVYDVNDTDNGYNKAAIGREPIVYVALKRNGSDCLKGFLKLKIVKEKPKAVDPIVYEKEFNVGIFKTPSCDGQEKDVVGTQAMNEQFYAVAHESKENFHEKYKFDNLEGGVGTVNLVPDEGDKTSFNLNYTLTADELWANAGKEVTKTAVFKNSDEKKEFKVTVKASIPSVETVNLNLVIGNYWYDGDTKHKSLNTGKYNAVTSNVAIPAAGAANPALCTWDNNINDVFNTGADKLLDLDAQGYKGYTYRYEFDTTQKNVSGVSFIVESSDAATGKVNDLLYGLKGGKKELVAKIKPAVANVGNNIEYQQTDLAKWLLNEGPESMRAKVVLVVLNTPCKKPVNVVITNVEEKDRFDVIFVRPVNVKDGSSTPFYDVVGAGNPGSYIDMKEVANLSDWRNYVTHTKEYAFSKYPNFYDYYDVVSIKADIANIKTENLAGVSPKLPSTLNIAQTGFDATGKPIGETFNGKFYKYGRLTYDNNGHNFNTDFTLIVPVTISYKWGDVKTMIRVEVNSTGTPKP